MTSDTYPPLIGDRAPDFSLADTTGKVHELASYRGHNVLLVFNRGFS